MESGLCGLTNIQRKLIDLSYANISLPRSRFKHFTYIVRRNKIIVFGVNHDKKTNPINQKYGYRYPQIHSEGSAIIAFPYSRIELAEYDFYNVRINNLGQISMSAPCPHCQTLLRSHGIHSIFQTTEQGRFERFYL